jgi:Dolichyl-phosphate-mannose-protein mannosyltransferase
LDNPRTALAGRGLRPVAPPLAPAVSGGLVVRPGTAFLGGLVLVGLFALRADHFARSTSQTFDEGAHLAAGVSYWRTGDYRLNSEHPPLLKILWAIPVVLRDDVHFDPDPDAWEHKDHWRVADGFLYDGEAHHFELLLAARRVNIALGVALVALIGWWAHRLWGPGAGLLACALAATDPNLAAFAALLSMDLGLALFATAAGYALWEYGDTDASGWFYLAGLCLGLCLATKFTGVLTVAGLAVGALAFAATGGQFTIPHRLPAFTVGGRLSAALSALIRLGLVAALVVVAAYAGRHALDWAAGFKQQVVRGDQGDPHFFLDGEISSTGWWRFFPIVLAIKTPPGTLVLAALSVAGLFFGRRFTAKDVGFVVIPPVLYALAIAAARIDLGWRVLLPAYPLLILVAARSATLLPKAQQWQTVGVVILTAAVLWSAADARHLGRELSYANGLGATRANLHERLGDSNIDWGQGLKALKSEVGDSVIYLSYAGTARPEAYGIRYERLPGWGQFHPAPADARVDPAGRVLVAVSVSNLQGTYLSDPAMYRWLLGREPVSRTDGSIWVFDVTGDAEALARLRALVPTE